MPFAPPNRTGGNGRDGQLHVLRSLTKLKIRKNKSKKDKGGKGDGTQAPNAVPPSRAKAPPGLEPAPARDKKAAHRWPASPGAASRTPLRGGRAALSCITARLRARSTPPTRREPAPGRGSPVFSCSAHPTGQHTCAHTCTRTCAHTEMRAEASDTHGDPGPEQPRQQRVSSSTPTHGRQPTTRCPLLRCSRNCYIAE